MNRAFQTCITLAALMPIAGFACGLDAVAQYVNRQEDVALAKKTQPSDEFQVTCGGTPMLSGTVSKDLMLRMTDGAEIDVSEMKRKEVLSLLRSAAVMMNTPNGVNITPKTEK